MPILTTVFVIKCAAENLEISLKIFISENNLKRGFAEAREIIHDLKMISGKIL